MSPELRAAFEEYEKAEGFDAKWAAYEKLIDVGGVAKWKQGALKKLVKASLADTSFKAKVQGHDPEEAKIMALDVAVGLLKEKVGP